jgi:hypothetical protein
MAENKQRRWGKMLVAFPEPGVLQFICESEEAAEDLYIDIRKALPDTLSPAEQTVEDATLDSAAVSCEG